MNEIDSDSSNRCPSSTKTRFGAFVRRQRTSVRKGGANALWRKAWTILSLGLAAFPLLVIRLLRPVITIRLCELISDRLGPYAAEPEVYLSERDAGMYGGRVLDIYYRQPSICNQQLKKMWDRSIRVWQMARPIGRLNRLIPGGAPHIVPWRGRQDRDIYGVLHRTSPHLNFTPKEELEGQAGLRELGIPEESPFICFYARDSAYLSSRFPDMDQHRYEYRNSDIQNYVPAAEEMANRGYFALRMGSVAERPMSTSSPMVLDYANNGRSEFLDIYLGSRCAFFICTTSGIEKVPMIFRRPCAYVNYLPFDHIPSWGPADLAIPKKLWLRDQGRYLTFPEIIGSDICRFNRTHLYEDMNIEIVENTPHEIESLAIEMDERLKGTWQPADDDEELQDRFWSLFKTSEDHGVVLGRVGADFLRQNQDLLD